MPAVGIVSVKDVREKKEALEFVVGCIHEGGVIDETRIESINRRPFAFSCLTVTYYLNDAAKLDSPANCGCK